MLKFKLIFLTLIFSSAAFAKPVLYVCERPAWEGVEGCGPNNTYYTYNLFLDTGDFSKKKPLYDFQMHQSCDASNATLWTYKYIVNDEAIKFVFNRVPNGRIKSQFLSVITLDRETLKASISNVQNGTELNCREEEAPNRRPGTSPAKRGF